jgi:NAD(P)-dependent dehydrogenase (short-subunit alcohol dehydrogenase family)
MVLNEFRLENKVAIVTGAGRGIGRGIAVTLAEAGADVVLAGRTESQLHQTAQEVQRWNRRALVVPTDVTNTISVGNLVRAAIEEFDKVDVLVNNAGIDHLGPVIPLASYNTSPPEVEYTYILPPIPEAWHRVLDTNVVGVVRCCQAVGPLLLRQQRGKVINISSVSALRGGPEDATYHASKAALNNFTRSLALEWAPFGVNVNAIAPGPFPTDIWACHPERPITKEQLNARLERIRQRNPLGRFGELREVGLLAVYLASEAANYMTGQIIVIDGGSTA